MLSKPEAGCEVENSRQKDSTCQGPEAGEFISSLWAESREGGRSGMRQSSREQIRQGPLGQEMT